jgi:PhoPQ-activated pathogenicity-related protein
METLEAFYSSIVDGSPRPHIKWTFESDGSIKVVSKERPREVKVWEAVNPEARNFRLDVIGPAYKSQVLNPVGPNTWVAHVHAPPKGWSASFVELTFPTTGRYPLKVTTGVRILPDTLPFPPPSTSDRK